MILTKTPKRIAIDVKVMKIANLGTSAIRRACATLKEKRVNSAASKSVRMEITAVRIISAVALTSASSMAL